MEQQQIRTEESSRGSDSSQRSFEERPARPRAGAEQVAAISALLRGEDPDAAEAEERSDRHMPDERLETVLDGRSAEEREEEGEEPESRPAPRPKARNLHELADQLGIEVSELYDLDIGLGDKATIKLGALKDAHGERVSLEQEIARKQGSLDERESAVRGAEARLVEVYEAAKQQLSPGIQQQIGNWLNQRDAQLQAREANALRRAMPEIGDEGWRGKFEQYLVKAGQEFGFSPAELIGMKDHRVFLVMKRLMDVQSRLDRLTSAKPKAPERPGIIPPQGRGGAGQSSAISRAKRSGKQGDQVRAVSSILRGER
ncbi:hypothetical protein RGQ15_22320 [Paracoccus sp. MBLB3053]|uniref:Uncharacterized protein n=1 Tax=Paracoccus aurantius TaxID=3073814 RepID=A0ABU2I0E7_9RHOB|nr:hypothetical protein [Paracoccus sp. MBLB3053]MDS9470285.1 hypothetical protein [Paracoccus sp. MBLB3053]